MHHGGCWIGRVDDHMIIIISPLHLTFDHNLKKKNGHGLTLIEFNIKDTREAEEMNINALNNL